MNTTPELAADPPAPRSRWNRLAPAITLVVFAPMVAEVLNGSTRLSFLFALVPEMMVWGCGALLARELVRRWQAGWTSLLFLGLALSVAEEFIIQQTSLAPLPWLGSLPTPDRVWGVNWLYFLFMLVYESVWVVLVPVQLTELLFPNRRRESWLRRGGFLFCTLIFLFGSFLAWFAWTQQARPNVFHVPKYVPPLATMLLGLLAIVLLIIAAFAKRRSWRPYPYSSSPQPPPSPGLVLLATLLFGFPWYLLMTLVFVPTVSHGLPFWVSMIVGIIWAFAVFLIIRRWHSFSGWTDMHRWALVCGAMLVNMSAGFLGSSSWPHNDLIFKCIFNVIAFAGLLWLARVVSRRASAPPS
jgi:hypothetical protein